MVTFLASTTKAFLDIHDSDNPFQRARKTSEAVVSRTAYAVADYWLMIASGAFIIVMDQRFGYGPIGLFLLMWAFDLVVAFAFVILWKSTGKDVTLGMGYRRAVDTIHNGSQIAGYLAFAIVTIKAAFWDGPEHIVIFFHREIQTMVRMGFVLLVLTAIQAAIWTPIYVLGFDTLTDLYEYMKGLVLS